MKNNTVVYKKRSILQSAKYLMVFVFGICLVFTAQAFEITPIIPNTVMYIKHIFLTQNGSNSGANSATGIFLDWWSGNIWLKWDITLANLTGVAVLWTNSNGKIIASLWSIGWNSLWTLLSWNIYHNNLTGNVGIGTTNPSQALHVSGNIIVGDIYTQISGIYTSILWWSRNSITGNYSAIWGWWYNRIFWSGWFIGWGGINNISGTASLIVWGTNNTIYWDASVVVWGKDNRSNTWSATFIGWGEGNSISWDMSIIVGWSGNTVNNHEYAFIGWGESNIIDAWILNYFESIINGKNNITDSAWFTLIWWGRENSITQSEFIFIGWGSGNHITKSKFVFIGWGENNKIFSNSNSSIKYAFLWLGINNIFINSWVQYWYANFLWWGSGNSISWTGTISFSSLIGWEFNAMQNNTLYSFIGWGKNNILSDTYYSFLWGWLYNTITWTGSNILWGQWNSVVGGIFTTILWWSGNTAMDWASYSTILWWSNNIVNKGTHMLVWGTGAQGNNSYTFVRNSDTEHIFSSQKDRSFLINLGTGENAGGVWINVNAPTTALDVDGLIRTRPRTTIAAPNCVSAKVWSIYYDSTLNKFRWCTANSWRVDLH